VPVSTNGAGFDERQLGHVQLALRAEPFEAGAAGAKAQWHAAADVTVDQEGGLEDGVPLVAEGLAFRPELAHGNELFRFHLGWVLCGPRAEQAGAVTREIPAQISVVPYILAMR